MPKRYSLFVPAIILAGVLLSCRTSVEPSPEPGIIRVTLKGADWDTCIIIQNDTSKFSRWDKFDVMVSQGRLYQGEIYAYLYNNPSSARKASDTANILAREWLDGTPITTGDATAITPANSRFRKYLVFESYAPPGTYDNISLSLVAYEMEIFIPKHYLNPVMLPPDVAPSIDFPGTYTITENGVTEVELELAPYQSLVRYQDMYYFERKIAVVDVH